MTDHRSNCNNIENGITTSTKRKHHEKDQAEITEVGLSDLMLDELYTSYSLKQRSGSLKWFFFACLLFDIWSLCIPYEQDMQARGKFERNIFHFKKRIFGSILCLFL